MKHTKNILKSLLITVMALSLLAVSCKKDEGGSKPTDPTPITITADKINTTLSGFGTVAVQKDGDSVDFAGKNNADGTVALEVTGGKTDKFSLNKFQSGMKSALEGKVANIPGVTVAVADTTLTSGNDAPAANNNKPVIFELTITAKTGYVLDTGIKGYQEANKTVKLTLKFTPSGSGVNWAA